MMNKLICYDNLAAEEGFEGLPWEFEPDPLLLQELKTTPVKNRRKMLSTPTTKWNFFSACRGVVSGMRVGKDNSVVGIRAFIVDFDLVADDKAVAEYLFQMPEHLQPNFASRSLGDKWHVAWIFEQELSMPGIEAATLFFTKLAEYLKADRILAGYDSASIKPTQIWTNGGDWFQINAKPLSMDIVTGVAVETVKSRETCTDIPLEVIAAEVTKRYPGKWKGEFVEGAAGVRFWDEKADNPRGAYVCKTGCYCLTGNQQFMRWGDIFGHQWAEDQRVVNLGKAASDVYFDSRQYWHELDKGRWVTFSREDTLLHFASRGLSRKQGKGVISDAEKVLKHVQNNNRVDIAYPVIYRPAGVLNLNGKRVLNTSNLQVAQPHEKKCEFSDAELFWSIMQTNSCDEALQTWLAWMKIAWCAGYYHQPTVGQAMFVCGPKSNGKTMLCMRYVAPLLGHQVGNPYDFLMKKTQFTDDLVSAVLWAINDQEAPATEHDRAAFEQGIKSLVVNPRMVFHKKFNDKIDAECAARVYITLNDDPKSVGILPELNSNTEDKMIFIRTVPYTKHWGPRHENDAQAALEIPIIASALQHHVIPDSILLPGSRAQIKSYHEPLLVEMSKQQDPSFNLHELVNTWQVQGAYWQNVPSPKTWEGTPTDLLTHLADGQNSATILKDWSVFRIARALTTLARNGNHGVEFIGEKSNRVFRITKLV